MLFSNTILELDVLSCGRALLALERQSRGKHVSNLETVNQCTNGLIFGLEIYQVTLSLKEL